MTIRLIYTVSTPVPEAQVFIALGDGIAFETKDAELKQLRAHVWRGALHEGENAIIFAVSAQEGMRSIETRADLDGLRHEHKILLSSEPGGTRVSYYILPARKLHEG